MNKRKDYTFTKKQVEFIRILEQNGAPTFWGNTKEDASKYIDDYERFASRAHRRRGVNEFTDYEFEFF